MKDTNIWSRDIPLNNNNGALLVIDMQHYCCSRSGGAFDDLDDVTFQNQYGYYFNQLNSIVVPNLQCIIRKSREVGMEVLYTVIEALTLDGRDRGLDYKISGFFIPSGSVDGKVIDSLKPLADEIVLRKSASSVFNATNIEYILKNMGISQLVLCGVYTEQCVESAVRDACDKGFLVSLVEDACATNSEEAHRNSLNAIKNYCRIVKTEQIISELNNGYSNS